MATQTIGEREVTLAEFSGYKGFYVGEIVARIGDELPKWQLKMAEFRDSYGQRKKNRISKEHAAARGLDIPDEAFAATGYFEYPALPDPREEILAVLPEAFKHARSEVVRILALVVVDDRELEDLDEAGTVDDVLLKRGKALLHEARLDQCAELILFARQELEGKLGAVLGGFLDSLSQGSQQASQEETSGTPSSDESAERGDTRRTELQVATFETEDEEEDASSQSPSSSTDSEPPTGGPEPTPSTASAGASSSSSTD